MGQGLNDQGQGKGVLSRFVNPNVSENSFWVQTSVDRVRPQPWSKNYRDGLCGIRKLNSAYAINDPRLATFTPADLSNCTNAADNPVHVTLQDKLIGEQQVRLT